MGTLLSLLGGPLDGIFLPLVAQANTLPGQLFVYYPEMSTWLVYRNREIAESVIDVYRLRRGGAPMVSKPKDVDVASMAYVRTLTPIEAQLVEKFGTAPPIGFK